MAVLRPLVTGAPCALEVEHIVGRSRRSALHIENSYISLQHASIRWVGDGWELKDLGSRNGTLVDGIPIKPGQAFRFRQGMKVSFGQAEQTWELVDDSPPQPMVIPLDAPESPCFFESDILALPSPDDPRATIFRAPDGSWRLEREDAELPIVHNELFQVADRQWRFSCPGPISDTSTIRWPDSFAGQIHHVKLTFRVSRDEEHIELDVDWGPNRRSLGSRAHNYLLLFLARARAADAKQGLPEAACGWVYQEEVLSALRASPERLNIDVFRIRKQFATLGIQDAADILERRPGSKQLRLGVATATIHSI